MKKILVTNDDGLDCQGIQVLASALSSIADVWIIAPDRNRSGVSHGITMSEPLRLKKVGAQTWTCSGLPVDCVISGLRGIMGGLPDVVVSGINQGANIGTDVLYSGTAAAARQAALYAVPAIAVSLAAEEAPWDYAALARFVRDNLERLAGLCSQDVFVNINAPSAHSYKGARLTSLARRMYCDTVQLFSAPDGHSYSFFQGGSVESGGEDDSDYAAVQAGYIAVSRVMVQPACADYLHLKGMEFII